MEPHKRDEAYSRYLDNQRKTRIIHKRERMRRMAEEGKDDDGKDHKDTKILEDNTVRNKATPKSHIRA